MKPVVRSFCLLLPLLMAGCVHKNDQVQSQAPLAPPIEDSPLPKPDSAPANLPPPVISVPQAQPQPPQTSNNTQPPPPPPPKHKKTKPAQPAAQPPAQTTEQAAADTPEVSAVGRLSSGDPGDLRDETMTLISDTERGLNGINRKLNDQEQKTSGQIREFLKQARTALTTNDVDGAHTLAMKAKVLLGELSQ